MKRKTVSQTDSLANRKIPATLVTQHPDHAHKPYWHDKTYLSTEFEAEEAYRSFSELGATEYKWDWEGKLVDESVVERLFGEYFSFFQKNPLGEKTFLTFRLPNPRLETEFRLGRAFMNMASAAAAAKHLGFRVPPLFEVILPMTETSEEMLALQEAFNEIHYLKHPLFKLEGFLTNLRVIPLFENIETIIDSDRILRRYLLLYKKKFQKKPPYMRPYLARSDPALNSGILATVLAIKIALARYAKLADKEDLPIHPILGAGSLPFRGGLTPKSVKEFAAEYKGIRTTTLQSAFRYDYPKSAVRKAIDFLETSLRLYQAELISKEEEKQLISLIHEAQKNYQKVIKPIARDVNYLAGFLPKRRERFLHIGLFGYSRGEKGVKLPRCIGFTAVLYSLGVPPEFIGTGRTLAYIKKTGNFSLLLKYYLNLKKDLQKAGRFLNKENLNKLAKKSSGWKLIAQDVMLAEKHLDIVFKAKTRAEIKHQQISAQILSNLKKPKKLTDLINSAALLRKSLG